MLVYITALLAVGVVILLNMPQTQTVTSDTALGKQVYEANCASCHGLHGEGEVPAAPLEPGPDGLFPAPPHDSTGHTWHHSDSLLREIIRRGSQYDGFKPMPAFEDKLTDEEIEAVLAYIKAWWTDEQQRMHAEASAREP